MERVREGLHGDGVGTALAPTYRGMLGAAAPGLGSVRSSSGLRGTHQQREVTDLCLSEISCPHPHSGI